MALQFKPKKSFFDFLPEAAGQFAKGVGNVFKGAVDTGVNTAAYLGDIGATAIAGAQGRKDLVQAGQQQAKERFNKTLPGQLASSALTIGNAIAAPIAESNLKRQGVSNDIIYKSINENTDALRQRTGLDTAADLRNSNAQNALGIAGAFADVGTSALGLGAGKGKLVQSPVKQAKNVAAYRATENQVTKSVPVSKLTSYKGAPDKLKVQEYKQQIQSGKKLDPIIVARDSKGNLGIEDGKHRYEAARQLGIKTLPVREVNMGRLKTVSQRGSVSAEKAADRGVAYSRPTVTAKQISAELSQQAKMGREQYKKNPVVKLKDAAADTFDPWRVAQRSDNKSSDGRSLVQAINKTANSDNIAVRRLQDKEATGKSVYDVIQESGGNKGGSDFVNYLTMRRDLRIRENSKGSKQLLPQFSDDELRAAVASQEASKPNYVINRQTIAAQANKDLDRAVKAGIVKKEDADFLKKYYGDDYASIQRATSQFLERPEISGRSLGSIGRQRIVQDLQANSDLAIDDTFDAIINRAKTTEKQINQAEAANIYAKRVLSGEEKNAKLIVGAGNKEGRKEVRSTQKEINAAIADLDKRIARTKDSRSRAELVAERQKLYDAKTINKDIIAQLQDDPTTGKQVISGIENGQPYKIEVHPDVAKLMQGLDSRKASQLVNWAISAQRVFQTAWTGFANVVFPIKSFVFYDILPSIANSKYGAKTVFSPTAVKGLVKGFLPDNPLRRELDLAGANQTMFSGIPIETNLTADAIAAQKNIFTKVGYGLTHPKTAIESLDKIGGLLSRVSRERNATVYYEQALKQGKTAEQAVTEAAWAYNNVLPNYIRASTLAKEMNAALPYFSASIAGTRSLLQGIKRNPGVALTTITAGVVGPAVAATTYSMMSEEGQKYYQDQIDSKSTYNLDNNYTIVLPGASKDPKTGQWSGIIKVPVSPEFRALNQALWRGTYDQLNEEAAQDQTSLGSVAVNAFDFVTGGLRGSSNPFVETGRIVVGQDPKSDPLNPKDLIQGDMKDQAKRDQFYESTSDAAKFLAGLTGNNLSPIQVDKILSQFGLAGKIVKNKDQNPLKTVGETFKDTVSGGYGQTDTSKYYEKLDSIKSSFTNSKSKQYFDALHKKNDQPGILDSATKASIYLSDPEVVTKEKELDQWNREQGKVGNPIFDLNGDQLQKVLAYRQAKMLNAGKQTYDRDGNSLFTSLGLDEPWYDRFREAENGFYDSIKKDNTASDTDPKTFSGAKKPSPTPELQSKLDFYYTLQGGTGDRSRFLRANPDVLAYWESSDGFTNSERAAIGLKPLEEEASKSGSGKSGNPTADAYKYAVSINAGGDVPSVQKSKAVAAKLGKYKVSSQGKSKPKVSIKKSLT